MPEEGFIIAVLCRAGDLLQSAPDLRGTRRRGFAPRPCDSGVITMEVAGEFLGMDGDKAVRGHFRRHWQCPFPGLRGAHGRGAAGTSPAGSHGKCPPAPWPSPSTWLPSGSHSSSMDCFNHEKSHITLLSLSGIRPYR